MVKTIGDSPYLCRNLVILRSVGGVEGVVPHPSKYGSKLPGSWDIEKWYYAFHASTLPILANHYVHVQVSLILLSRMVKNRAKKKKKSKVLSFLNRWLIFACFHLEVYGADWARRNRVWGYLNTYMVRVTLKRDPILLLKWANHQIILTTAVRRNLRFS